MSLRLRPRHRVLTAAGVVLLLLLLAHPAVAKGRAGVAVTPQPVVLLLGSRVLDLDLPVLLTIQPGRHPVAAMELARACRSPTLRRDGLLLYRPDSRSCEQILDQDIHLLRQRLQQLDGRWLDTDPRSQLRETAFMVLAAAPVRRASAPPVCTCVGNTPPTGIVSCEAQSRTVRTFIAPVEFLASDADGDALIGEFSHQRDDDPVQAGLPAPLTSSCNAEMGTLLCRVDGIAPAEAQDLQLTLTVSDGQAILRLDSLLELVAAPEEYIFRAAFELPVCP